MKVFIKNWYQELAGGFACVLLFSISICMLSANVVESNNVEMSELDSKDIINTHENTHQITNTIANKNNKVITHVHLTCYQPVEAQCNADPLHTADGSFINLQKLKQRKLNWIAISPDIEWLIPMGSKVRLTSEKTGKCYGVFIVKDRMNKRWNHKMDILIHPDSKLRISEKNVKVELI